MPNTSMPTTDSTEPPYKRNRLAGGYERVQEGYHTPWLQQGDGHIRRMNIRACLIPTMSARSRDEVRRDDHYRVPSGGSASRSAGPGLQCRALGRGCSRCRCACASAPDADRRAWPTLRRQNREELLCSAPCPPVIASAAPERDCAALRDFSAPAWNRVNDLVGARQSGCSLGRAVGRSFIRGCSKFGGRRSQAGK